MYLCEILRPFYYEYSILLIPTTIMTSSEKVFQAVALIFVLFVNVSYSLFHIRSNGEVLFFNNKVECMAYDNAAKFCDSIGGHLPTIHSQEDLDDYSEIVMKHKLKYTAFWLWIDQSTDGSWTWADESDMDFEIKRSQGSEECKGDDCRVWFSATDAVASSVQSTKRTNCLCVVSDVSIDVPLEYKSIIDGISDEISLMELQDSQRQTRLKEHLKNLNQVVLQNKASLRSLTGDIDKIKQHLKI